jgi:hypothetical protein
MWTRRPPSQATARPNVEFEKHQRTGRDEAFRVVGSASRNQTDARERVPTDSKFLGVILEKLPNHPRRVEVETDVPEKKEIKTRIIAGDYSGKAKKMPLTEEPGKVARAKAVGDLPAGQMRRLPPLGE